MKRYFPLLILFFAMTAQRSSAQAILSMSPVYQKFVNDTTPANVSDSLIVFVKNTGTVTYFNYLTIYMAVQDSAATTYHAVDSTTSFIPVSIAPGDSASLSISPFYDINDSTRFHYDINVIVIWPIAVNIGDSLSFIQVLTLPDGIPEVDPGQFIRGFPNPVSHDLNLKNDVQTAIEEVRIYDARGRLVKIERDTDMLCTDDWKAGTYLLHITTKDKRSCTIRVIRQ